LKKAIFLLAKVNSADVPSPTALKNFFGNLLLVLLSLFFILLMLEALLRAIGYNPFGEILKNEDRAIFIRPSENPQRIFEATPNASGQGWGTRVSINRFGFRGRDYTTEKPSGTYRIAVIGDSITFGNNLPPDANYPALLEKRFAQSGKKVEVLNLALGGYDTLQEVATLEEIGLQFHPDLVLIGYCINDIGIASGNLNYIKRLQKYGDPIYHLRLAQWIRIQLDRIDQENSTVDANKAVAFYSAYRDVLADIEPDSALATLMQGLSGELARSGNRATFTADYTDANHVRRLRFALEKLHALQSTHHFTVSAIVFPYLLEKPETHAAYQLSYRIVEHEMQRLGFSVIDIYTPFTSAGLDHLLLRNNDGVHPNAEGHRIVAETLYQTFFTTP
jgi:lysophospholipase L1-like esterase